MTSEIETEKRWFVKDAEHFIPLLRDCFGDPELRLKLSTRFLARSEGGWEIDGAKHRIRETSGDLNKHLYMIKTPVDRNSSGAKNEEEETVRILGDGEDLQVLMNAAKERLGYLPVVGFFYEKMRATWFLEGARIDLDYAPFLGWFIEIEADLKIIDELSEELELSEVDVDRGTGSYNQHFLDEAKKRGWSPKFVWLLAEDEQGEQEWERYIL